MILDGEGISSEPAATFDDLFRRAGVRAPQDLALVDPPNRAQFTDGAPRALTYAEADRAIGALAARLRGLGLSTDAVVAIQLANTVEAVIALLGVLRAGMIAAPLPLLWRRQDIVAALSGIGAKAIVTCARVGDYAPVETALLAAAELFSVRHVCAFGSDLPDGVVPLDEAQTGVAEDFRPPPTRIGQAAAHVAIVTFDVRSDGIVPVARNHLQSIAGGLTPFLEMDLARQAVLVSTLPPVSFAGIALGLVPWLLAGGTLALHQGCDLDTLTAQCAAHREATVVVPGPALMPLNDAGRFGALVKTLVALWRAPERLGACAPWRGNEALVDVIGFGETGLLAARRATGGLPASIPCGAVSAPRHAPDAVTIIETARSGTGSLLLRGPMVPVHAFPPQSAPSFASSSAAAATANAGPAQAGFVDTGFSCRRDGDVFMVNAPPTGITTIGGYRFRQQAFEAEVTDIDPTATLVTVPNVILGARLAGDAADPPALRAALRARGVNPLVAGAFRPRRADAAA